MTNLTRLPPTTTMDANQALQCALNDYLTDVMIIGYDNRGDLCIYSSRMTSAEGLFLAVKAMRWAESGGEA